jgi:hypothetical protein
MPYGGPPSTDRRGAATAVDLPGNDAATVAGSAGNNGCFGLAQPENRRQPDEKTRWVTAALSWVSVPNTRHRAIVLDVSGGPCTAHSLEIRGIKNVTPLTRVIGKVLGRDRSSSIAERMDRT